MKQLALTLTFLLALLARGYGQIGFGSPATVVAAPNSISYCESDPTGFFEINWTVNGAVAEGVIEVVLPRGARLVPGSKEDRNTRPAGITTNVLTRGDTLVFVFRGRADGDEGTIRYRLAYDCSVATAFEAPYELPVRAITGADTFAVRSAPINSTGSQPIVTPVATAQTNLRDVVIGSTRTRAFAVAQTGQRTRAYSFLLCVNYGDGLTPSAQTLEGVPVNFPNGRNGCVQVSQADYPGLPWPFASGNRWTFRETVTVEGCDNIWTTVGTSFGCGPEDCQETAEITPEVQIEDALAVVSIARQERTLLGDGCVTEGARMEVDFELTGKGFDTRFVLESISTATYIDTSTVEVDWGDGTYRPWSGGYAALEPTGGCAVGRYRTLTSNPLDGVIDATANARLIRVRYEVKWCCEAATVDTISTQGIYNAAVQLLTDDICGVTRQMRSVINGYPLSAKGSPELPTRIADGETVDFVLDVEDLTIIRDLRPLTQVCAQFELPAGLSVAPGAEGTYRDFAGGQVYTSAVEVMGGGRYRACFASDLLRGPGTSYRIPVTYNCTPATAGTTVEVATRFQARLGTGACVAPAGCTPTLFRVTGRVALGSECVTTACDGVEHVGASLTRQTFGAPDADRDGCADVGATLDMEVVRADHAMEGDVVALSSAVVIRAADPAATFGTVTAEARFSAEHELRGAPALEVYDASTGTTHACGTVAAEVLDSVTLRYRFAAAGLRGCGGLPGDFAFGPGDSLRLRAEYVVLENPGRTAIEATVALDWYADRGATAGADRLQCNGPDLAKYKNVGYFFQVSSGPTRAYGCSGTYYEQRMTLDIGGSTIGSAFWPGEIRSYGTLEATTMQIPPGMRVDSILVPGFFTTTTPSRGFNYNGLDATPYAEIDGDTVRVDWSAIRANCEEIKMRPGSGYYLVIGAFLDGSCASERIAPVMAAEIRFDYPEAGGFADRTLRTEALYGNLVTANVPEPLLETSTPEVPARDQLARWNFSLRETAGGAMPNAWVGFRSPSGALVPVTVTFRGDTIAPVDGVYRLGEVARRSINQLTVTTTFSGCGADSLQAFAGWGCADYPASVAEALSPATGGEPVCAPLELTLRMRPSAPAIQQTIVSQPAPKGPACADLPYEFEFVNVADAVVYEPVIEFFAPYTDGLTVVPMTASAAYPAPAYPATADFAHALGEPTSTSVTPLGIRYIWELRALIPDFDPATGDGWLGQDASAEGRDRIRVRFEARTDCDFVIGDFASVVARGRSACGTPTRTVLRNTDPIEFAGISAPYAAAHEMVTPEELDACAGGLVELPATATFFAQTDGADEIVLALPPALTYAGLRTDDEALDTAGVTVTRIDGGVGGAGFDEVRIGVAAGVRSFREIAYTVLARLRPEGISCDEPATAILRSVRGAQYECRGATCDGRITSGALLPAPTFTLVTDTIAASGLHLGRTCAGDSLRLEAITIENLTSGEISAPVTIEIFRDRDHSGGASPGDDPVATFTTLPAAAAGASVVVSAGAVGLTDVGEALDACGLYAVIAGCSCERFEVPIEGVRVWDATTPTAEPACSGQAVAIGCGSGLAGYTYAWAPAPGSPAGELRDATAAQTELSYVNPVPRDTTLTYLRTASSPSGCVSVDTVSVRVSGSCVTIGDYAWIDADGDGIQDPTEAPLPDVAVTLYDDADDRALGTTLTSQTGRYGFDDFPAGRYYLVFDATTSALGEGAVPTLRGEDPLAPDDSNVDETGRTRVLDYDPLAGPVTHIDAGFLPVGELAAVLDVAEYELLPDDIAELRLRLAVRNTGTADLEEVTIRYDPAADFGEAFRSARLAPAREAVLGAEAAAPTPNAAFDGGMTDDDVLAAGVGAALASGEGFTYDVYVRFEASATATGILTQAATAARVRIGAGGAAPGPAAPVVEDVSDGGDDFAGTNPGAPGDRGTDDDPLEIACLDADVVIAGDGASVCAGASVTLRIQHPLGALAQVEWRDAAGATIGSADVLDLSTSNGEAIATAEVTGVGPICYYGRTAAASVSAGEVPTLLTPDDDGANDVFRIPCIEGRPGSGIAIYNRWGDAVYAAEDYGNDWGGTYKGDPLPEGTYFYILTVGPDPSVSVGADPEAETITGYVYLRR